MSEKVTLTLGVSSSPRMVWVWGRTLDHVDWLRTVLISAGCPWYPVERDSKDVELATNIDIGVVAAEAMEVLAAEGAVFEWSDEQYSANRTREFLGFPIMGGVV